MPFGSRRAGQQEPFPALEVPVHDAEVGLGSDGAGNLADPIDNIGGFGRGGRCRSRAGDLPFGFSEREAWPLLQGLDPHGFVNIRLNQGIHFGDRVRDVLCPFLVDQLLKLFLGARLFYGDRGPSASVGVHQPPLVFLLELEKLHVRELVEDHDLIVPDDHEFAGDPGDPEFPFIILPRGLPRRRLLLALEQDVVDLVQASRLRIEFIEVLERLRDGGLLLWELLFDRVDLALFVVDAPLDLADVGGQDAGEGPGAEVVVLVRAVRLDIGATQAVPEHDGDAALRTYDRRGHARTGIVPIRQLAGFRCRRELVLEHFRGLFHGLLVVELVGAIPDLDFSLAVRRGKVLVQVREGLFVPGDTLWRGVYGPLQAPALVVERALERGKLSGPVLELDFLSHQRIAGGDGDHFGRAHGILGDILDLALGDVAREELVEHLGLVLDLVPHEGVNRALGGIVEDAELPIMLVENDVALALAAAVALQVGGDVPPNVQVVHRRDPRLDVDSGAGLLG